MKERKGFLKQSFMKTLGAKLENIAPGKCKGRSIKNWKKYFPRTLRCGLSHK